MPRVFASMNPLATKPSEVQVRTAMAWLELILTAADLLAWTQSICLDGDLARAEPATLRYRLLHTAGRITRTARRVNLALPEHWPWARDLHRAYQHLEAFTT